MCSQISYKQMIINWIQKKTKVRKHIECKMHMKTHSRFYILISPTPILSLYYRPFGQFDKLPLNRTSAISNLFCHPLQLWQNKLLLYLMSPFRNASYLHFVSVYCSGQFLAFRIRSFPNPAVSVRCGESNLKRNP